VKSRHAELRFIVPYLLQTAQATRASDSVGFKYRTERLAFLLVFEIVLLP